MHNHTTGCESSAVGTKGPALPLQEKFPSVCSACTPSTVSYTTPLLLYCSPTVELSLCGLTEAMNAVICVCVLLSALSGSSLGRPSHSQDEGKPEPPQLDSVMSPQHTRHTRSAPPSGQLTPFSKPAEDEAEDSRTNLRELLARLIKDRDYLGWMDFGRRSAEEYEEYSS
ncbi:unnamed protein product [Coregonus sp. 'balchen']|nr:unnamed protein product [Coregonus sp. 'balchen']